MNKKQVALANMKRQTLKVRTLDAIYCENVNYTEQEIIEIHGRGNLTLMEKVMDLAGVDLCVHESFLGGMGHICRKYDDCRACTYHELQKTGKKEFEPILKNLKLVNMSIGLDNK